MSVVAECFQSRAHQYSRVDGQPSTESDQEKAGDDGSIPRSLSDRTKSRHWLILAIELLILLALLVVAFSTGRVSDLDCSKRTTIWSPIEDAIDLVDEDLYNPFAHETIYRGPPTPALEEAWQDLWLYGGVRIPADKLPTLNRTFDLGQSRTARRIEDDEGGHYALVEVFHQLHCLNLIRQYTWKDYYARHPEIVNAPADLLTSEVESRMHVDHCIEALRLALMCHGDTTPYLVMDDASAPLGIKADFSAHHKCRNFSALQEWIVVNQINGAPEPPNWRPDNRP